MMSSLFTYTPAEGVRLPSVSYAVIKIRDAIWALGFEID
jgi:hypothetical protein